MTHKPQEITLQQRQATKRVAIKRLKKIGLNGTINYINRLINKFPKNQEYYSSLIKGLKKLEV